MGVGQFERISLRNFTADWLNRFPVSQADVDIPVADIVSKISDIYDDIKLPQRSTKGSAGYDIYSPIGIRLLPEESVWIPLGIKCRIEPGWVLVIVPRSGSGSKFKLRLANTVGVIDSDYYNNKDNEGHIQVKLCNEGEFTFDVEAGTAIAQAIFLPYGITDDDNTEGERNGGFGSTDSGGNHNNE